MTLKIIIKKISAYNFDIVAYSNRFVELAHRLDLVANELELVLIDSSRQRSQTVLLSDQRDKIRPERVLFAVLDLVETQLGGAMILVRVRRYAPAHVHRLKVEVVLAFAVVFETRIHGLDEMVAFAVCVRERRAQKDAYDFLAQVGHSTVLAAQYISNNLDVKRHGL